MNKFTMLLLAGTALAGIGAALAPGEALATAVDACPNTIYTNSATTPPNCNLVITFNSDGSVTTNVPVGATSKYDCCEDALIGVKNNTGSVLTSFNISGNFIFGFDSDGIDTYTGIGPQGSNPDTSGYGGPNGFFTNITASLNSGTVNFANGGIAANGGWDYFSLEEPINMSALPTITNTVPEPASIALIGAGLAGLGFLRRRKAKQG